MKEVSSVKSLVVILPSPVLRCSYLTSTLISHRSVQQKYQIHQSKKFVARLSFIIFCSSDIGF
jgi:hypothetical protein